MERFLLIGTLLLGTAFAFITALSQRRPETTEPTDDHQIEPRPSAVAEPVPENGRPAPEPFRDTSDLDSPPRLPETPDDTDAEDDFEAGWAEGEPIPRIVRFYLVRDGDFGPHQTTAPTTYLVVESVAIPRELYEDLHDNISSPMLDRGLDATSAYLTEKLTEHGWAKLNEYWLTQDVWSIDSAVQDIDTLDADLREFLLGQPAMELAEWLDFQETTAAVIAGIAAQTPLPTDLPVREIKTFLEVAGMAIGVAIGLPVLSTACFKSFAHDQFMLVMAEGLKCIAKEIIDPAIPEEPVAAIESPAPAAAENLNPVAKAEELAPVAEVEEELAPVGEVEEVEEELAPVAEVEEVEEEVAPVGEVDEPEFDPVRRPEQPKPVSDFWDDLFSL